MQCAIYWCIYAPLLTEGIFGEIPASNSYLDEGPDRRPAYFGVGLPESNHSCCGDVRDVGPGRERTGSQIFEKSP